MARFHVETLAASRRLIAREPRQRGRIAAARVQRSVSTAVIKAWQSDNGSAARDFKHALSLLILLGGRYRRDDG